MKVRKEDIKKLKDYYRIRGDGVAQIKLEKVVQSTEFQASLKKLAEYNPSRDSATNTEQSLITP